MRIAVFDYFVDGSNAIGHINQVLLQGLGGEHQFTVYAATCALQTDKRIRWVRVPTTGRSPLLWLFLIYRSLASLRYLWDKHVRNRQFDLCQSIESITRFGDVVHAHFCHRYFLRHEWRVAVRGHRTLRTLARGWDHRLRALCEPAAYRRARWVVVPSLGLQRELEQEYPWLKGRIRLIHNPINLERMQRPASFAGDSLRQGLGLRADGRLFCFIALGHFERKGLPLLMQAVQEFKGESPEPFTILVVGGQPGLVQVYRQRVEAAGLGRLFRFVGRQPDIRPYLWASEALLLPSYYEVLPTVALEAAAAGVPILSTPLNGVEEFLRDGQNGLLLPREAAGIAKVVRHFLCLSPVERAGMGQCAREAVQAYTESNFIAAWKKLYADIAPVVQGTTPQATT